MGNRKVQRITVGVIIGVVVISLALSLVSASAGAGPPAANARSQPLSYEVSPFEGDPAPSTGPQLGGTTEPKLVTDTPQGQATQVTDSEHIGGLMAFIVFMLGGALLLLRSRRRDRVEAGPSAADERSQAI